MRAFSGVCLVRQTKTIMPCIATKLKVLLYHLATVQPTIAQSSMSTSEKKATPQYPYRNGERSHTWSFPIRSIVVVELLERAKVGVVVVDDLLEGGIANTARRLPVFTRQMAHGPPVVHVLVAASGHSRREQRSEHEKLHGGEGCNERKNGQLLENTATAPAQQ